jgi:hypothetical protein
MNIQELIDDIVSEVSYRTGNGLVDFKNREHLYILSEVLTEMGLSGVKDELIQTLTEADAEPKKAFKNPLLNKVITYKNVNGEEAEGRVGDLLYRPKEEDAYIKAVGALGGTESDAYKKAMDDLGAQGQPGRDIDAEREKGGESGDEAKEEPQTGTALKDPSYQKQVAKEKEIQKKLDPEDGEETEGKPDGGRSIETLKTANSVSLSDFIKNGFSQSKGAPGSPGSMLNEILSVSSSTDALNSKDEFDYDYQLKRNIEIMKGTKLSEENEGNKASGKKTAKEAKELAKKEGISVALASKIIISTKAARNKHNRIKKRIIEKNNLKNYETIPLFGDKSAKNTQRELVTNASGKVKLGNREVSKQEAIEIINSGGGGKNPSDTAIFTIDKDTGDIYMVFFSDKDSTNAIVAQSSIKAENALKVEELREMISEGLLSETDVTAATELIESSLVEYESLERELNDIVNSPGNHLKGVDAAKLVKYAKNISTGANADRYWKSQIVAKFSNPGKKLGKKLASDYLPKGHQTPPTDDEMMVAYVSYINDDGVKGNLSKYDQRVVMDLSNSTDGPKLGGLIGEIRKKTIRTDLSIIEKLNTYTVTLDIGDRIGLGTYLEAKSVSQKLHLEMLFGGDGVYRDDTAFSQESGGVTVDKEAMSKCLPFDNENDMLSHFEIGEDRETTERGSDLVTGGNRIVYAVTKDGKKYAIAEKTQRSKSGPLGKLETVYKYHTELQNCFDSNG